MRINKLKDWGFDGNGEERIARAKCVFNMWYKRNLVITHGTGHTAEDIFGLPYTSSSSFAAIWNVQGEAYYKKDPDFFFRYVAITEDCDIVVGLKCTKM